MEKIGLIHEYPPLYKMRFEINHTNIYIKRDDLIEFALGGNKVRLFEYLAADIIKKKADKIITFGSIHSNHLRVTAIIAKYLGIDCDLIVLTNNEKIRSSPNLEIAKLGGNVKIFFCKTDEAHEFIDYHLKQQNGAGASCYWIPGGGHTPIAALGYVDAGREIINQLQGKKVVIDAAFVPCGTGTTQTGLLGSIKEFPVYGITVARTVDRCRHEISSLLEDMKRLGFIDSFSREQIHVLNMEKKYGEIDLEIQCTIEKVLATDGIILDPVYNAKCFLRMVKFLKENNKFENVLYINTGGTPNIFERKMQNG